MFLHNLPVIKKWGVAMKVLQVNCVYKKGSTGKITYDLHKGLLDGGIESVVCYGRGELVNEPGVYKTCPEWYSKLNNALSRITGIMYGGCFFSTNKLISIIKKEKPDVVHLQCINGYFVNIYRLVTWLKKNHIKTVLTLHAEFMYTANCGHALDCDRWKSGCSACPRRKAATNSIFFDGTAESWKRMKKAFDGFNDDLIVVSVSPWLMDRAKQAAILADKSHCVIFNGLNTGIFHPYDTSALRVSLGLTDEKIIFHATPSFSLSPDHIKGGYYVVELAKRLEHENVKVIVAGPYPSDITLPQNMIMLGNVSNQVLLAQYYSMADVTLLTSKKETYSMIVAESLCCGTPVTGFRAGAPEQITIPEYSRFCEYGDVISLADNILHFLDVPVDVLLPIIAEERYSTKIMVDQYMATYSHLIGEDK